MDARNSPLKCDIRIVMIELAGDEIDEEAATEEWTNKLDREGLWHINDVFNLFVAIEFEAKRLLLAIKKDESSLNLKEKLHNAINSSEDIQFKWWLLSAEIEDNVASVIFNTLVDIYVDIRGFAFVSGCIEMYKNCKSQHYKRRPLSGKNLVN